VDNWIYYGDYFQSGSLLSRQ